MWTRLLCKGANERKLKDRAALLFGEIISIVISIKYEKLTFHFAENFSTVTIVIIIVIRVDLPIFRKCCRIFRILTLAAQVL